MVNKTNCALVVLLLLTLSVQGCAKQASNSPANEDKKAPMCEAFAQEFDKEEFRAAYKPLLDKQELLALVDKEHSLPADYIPQDLVGSGKSILRQEARSWMLKMQKAAEKDGINLFPVSAYRSYAYQQMLTRRTRNPDYVAAPGHSQHQLGTAVDFNTVEPEDENIPALKWLRKHAGEYGFSLSFPKGEEQETGYPYEAWHYRYITPQGVFLQDHFFGGSQHKMLTFLHMCLWYPETINTTQQTVKENLLSLTTATLGNKKSENVSQKK